MFDGCNNMTGDAVIAYAASFPDGDIWKWNRDMETTTTTTTVCQDQKDEQIEDLKEQVLQLQQALADLAAVLLKMAQKG